MLKSFTHWLLATVGAAACLALADPAARAAAPEEPAALQFFEAQVRPLLATHCLKCHGAEDKIKGGLRLTSRQDTLKGGDLGPIVNLERPQESILVRAIHYRDDKLQMPPKGKLPAEAIAVFTKWVEMGLPFSPGSLVATKSGENHEKPKAAQDPKAFWSFQPLKRPDVPQVKRGDWVRNPIDAFILRKLEEKGFTPAPEATKLQLLRRAYYDLTGLPPTPADVEAFLADASPDAYEKVIDRLLASPHYGEKWGRHWLDLVRFAETNSYERDGPKPNAWRYRDYVIKSFNDDKPYDRFLKEQLAGDETPEAKTSSEPIVATGYYRLGIWDDEPTDPVQSRYDGLDDIVATTGQVMLGLTIDCARCHDHKIDPIPQKDYYKLLAFFHNINHFRNGGPTDEAPVVGDGGREAFEQRMTELAQQRKQTQELVEEAELNFKQLLEGEPGREPVLLADLPDLIRKEGKRVLGEERFKQYMQLRRRLRDSHFPSEVPTALAVTEPGPGAPETFVHIRGSAHAPGAKVDPGFPEILSGNSPTIPQPSPGSRSSGRRTVLADWIASPDNKLTARVMANRLFQYHFGRGIVRSPNNFGLQGDPPTHPELLDWLATEFTARGWKMKAMHRLIMTSSAYRMASTGGDRKALAADPRNDLMWRFDLRRLTAEELRDSILALNGTLNTKLYGPSVYPPIPKEVLAGQSVPGKGWETSGPADSARRSVYVHVKRSLRLPILQSFDAAEPDTSCPVRFVTVQPTQALGTLNSEFMNQEADKLAQRLKREAGDDVKNQVALGMRLVTCRAPTDTDIARGVEFIQATRQKDGVTPDVALKYFCLLALNLNEFVYLD